MLTISGGKTLGCFAIADDSALPPSTSPRTSPRTFFSSLFSVCSARMVRARSSERPELIIVANCRDMTARSLSFTLAPSVGRLISRFIPALAWVMLTGAYPMVLSFCTTWPWFSASSLPLTSLPPRSRTAYSYVSVAIAAASDPAEESVVVLGVVTLVEAVLVGDLPGADQLGQVLVEGVHAVLRAGLHGGVDLVRLALPDQVADRRCRGHDLRG